MPNPFDLVGSGVDVSHYNSDDRGSNLDWVQVRAAGYAFALIKATDGDAFVDPAFTTNVANATAAGLLVGAFHFFRPGIDSSLQAQNFLAQVNAVGGPGVLALGAAVDVEDPDDDPGAWNRITGVQRIAKVSNFLSAIEPSFATLPLIYTNPQWWAGEFGLAGDFSGHPLWAVSLNGTPDLKGTTWPTYALWQYSFSGSVSGIGFKNVDLNRPNP